MKRAFCWLFGLLLTIFAIVLGYLFWVESAPTPYDAKIEIIPKLGNDLTTLHTSNYITGGLPSEAVAKLSSYSGNQLSFREVPAESAEVGLLVFVKDTGAPVLGLDLDLHMSMKSYNLVRYKIF